MHFNIEIIKYKIIDFSRSYYIDNVKVGFNRKIKMVDVDTVLMLLKEGLLLFKTVFPEKYKDFLNDVKKIYVIRDTKSIVDSNNLCACYKNDLKCIVFPLRVFFNRSEVQNIPGFLGSLLLHESQHARLHRLGFASVRETLGRQERICYTVQKRFGVKIRDQEIVDYCNYALFVDLEKYFSSEFFIDRQLSDLVSKELPEWLKKYLAKKLIKKYMQHFGFKTYDNLPEKVKKWSSYIRKTTAQF